MNKLDKIIMGFRDYSKAHKFRLDNKFPSNILIQSKDIVFDFFSKFNDIENSIEKVNYSEFIIKRIDYFKDKAILIDLSEIQLGRIIEKEFIRKLETSRMYSIRLFLIYPVKSIWDVPVVILNYCHFTVNSKFQIYYQVYTDDMRGYDFLILDSTEKELENIVKQADKVIESKEFEILTNYKITEGFKEIFGEELFDAINVEFEDTEKRTSLFNKEGILTSDGSNKQIVVLNYKLMVRLKEV